MAGRDITGKFFTIRSLSTKLVLDIEDSIAMPAQPVHTAAYTGADNQLWFTDPVTRTVRSKLDDSYCLDLNGDRLVINYYKAEEWHQKWHLSGQCLQNYHPGVSLCLGIEDGQSDPGAFVTAEPETGAESQLWTFEYRAPIYCLIKSYMHGKVLDIKYASSKPGADLIMYEKKGGSDIDNQLWYEDQDGVIKSKLNNFAIASAGTGKDCKMQPYDSNNPQHHWVKSGNKIVPRGDPSTCLDIKGGYKGNRANLCPWGYKGSENQHWYFDYIHD